MSKIENHSTRGTHEAESRRVRTIEDAIAAQCPGVTINFAAGRERELKRVRITEPSALALERERRREARARK